MSNENEQETVEMYLVAKSPEFMCGVRHDGSGISLWDVAPALSNKQALCLAHALMTAVVFTEPMVQELIEKAKESEEAGE